MLYTLQIAINHYHPDSGVSSLSGCENDVRNMTAYLESRFSKDQLNARVLINEAATYDNIIKHFGQAHLLKAEEGDLVFIQYSGHGAREGAAPEFAKYAPEGKQETWVCYDSRLPGHYDLADKELAVLIERISNKGAEVILLFDCCHAGSGTRSLDRQLGKSRQWDDRKEVRPLETYLDGHFVNNIYVPVAKHLLMAGCDKREKAFELQSDKGNFTTHLLSVLNNQEESVSYAQVFDETKILMRKLSDTQTPQLEPEGFFNVHNDFLSFSGASRQKMYSCYFENGQWTIGVGAIKGLPTTPGAMAQFEIYQKEKLVGHAESVSVSLKTSVVNPSDNLNTDVIYQARILSFDTNQTIVSYETDENGKPVLEEMLEDYDTVHFRLVENDPQALYHLRVAAGELTIIRRSDQVMIRTEVGFRESNFTRIFQYLEHISAWEKTLDLENKAALGRRDVEIVLVELDEAGTELRTTSDQEVIIDILKENGREQIVHFRLEIHNRVAKPFYAALFYLSGNYGVHRIYNEEIPGNSTVIVMEQKPGGEPNAFRLGKKNEATDIFKLIASEEKIEEAVLTQKPIKLGERAFVPKGIIGFEDEFEQATFDDWFTVTMRCKVIAQQAKVSNQDISLAGGTLKVLANDIGFQANIALINSNPNGRSADPVAAIARLAAGAGMELLPLGMPATRSVTAPNVLVLQDISNKENLKEQPLKIALNIPLTDQETIFPVTFDGEHLLPVGMVDEGADGSTIISIDEIPDIEEKGRRSLGKALKLCFLKLAIKSKNIQELCWADYSQPTVERRTEGLITRVKDASNILLVIHGIIGDTKCMAECMRKAWEEGTYDLVLSFDYENLNTPIEKTAAALKVKLREAGIHPPTGKKITILAHSMGGLVSRYFIEELSGKEVVNHLIMAGTPNAGSAFAKLTKYRNHAITILGFAANSVFGLPAAATLLAALKQSKKLTPTLEQMDYDNGDFLKPLNSGDAPGIPYSIVAGHLDRFLEKDDNGGRLMNKLLKAGGKTFYGTQSNDIAVSVNSIKSIAQSWTPKVVEVACHHMNYFDDEESVGAIYEMI